MPAPVTISLTLNKPVETPQPDVIVANLGAPGTYNIELVVIDDLGRESAPGKFRVTVVQQT